MNKYIVDTFHNETKLFEEISSALRKMGISAQCVLDDMISVDAKKNTSEVIADVTGRYIMDNLETDKVYEILKQQCFGKDEIEGAVQCFKNDTFNRYSRLCVLKRELKEALLDYGRINVEGLLNFRLHKYNHMLYRGTEMALDDYIANKAYEDFLNLLEYYVSIQDSRYDTVVVTQTADGYMITDENGENINDEDDTELFDSMEISHLKADDILIERLMNIAPEKIILNADADKPIIKTLRRIFAKRIVVAE